MAKEKKVKLPFKVKRIGKKKDGRFGVYALVLNERPTKKGVFKENGYRLLTVFTNALAPANAEADAFHTMRMLEQASTVTPAARPVQ